MRYRSRPYFNSTVDTETAEAIIELANNNNMNKGRALDLIVQEWRENKEIEPVKSTPNIGGLSDFGESLNNIDARLSQIEGQLADAKSSNTP